MDFLKELNSSQQQAVLNTEGPSLVIAGAGSGKTRVLTYRIANLLSKGVPSYRIMALTFTNKAAREMQRRIASLVGEYNASSLWMGTFHSMFLRILRVEAGALGYSSNFTIYDTQDVRNLIKSIIKELKLDDKVYKPNEVLSRISMAKNNLIVAQAYAHSANIQTADKAARKPMIGEIYRYYEARCKASDVMDFDDLLLQTNILFRDFPEILKKYQQKFDYILVDEYQDTNYSQYLIIKRLVEVHKNICVVGDDAQSIYSFRGARIENILNFKNDYPDYNLYKLEQNYRSTKIIVDAANSIIQKNREQIPKKLFSDNEEGKKIKVIKALTDKEEGFQVVNKIFQLSQNERQNYDNFAILYRTNAQSRILEEALRRRDIPYRIYGGTSFYQRKEIKDLLAYLRLVVNQNDEEALRRIINYPKRGIGDTTIMRIVELTQRHQMSMWEVLSSLSTIDSGLSAATITRLNNFRKLIQNFIALSGKESAYEVASKVAKASGIVEEVSTDSTPEGISKKENVQEMLNAVNAFSQTAYKEGSEDSLAIFLQSIALLTDQDKEEPEEHSTVTLMTIHSAKGLEFPNVFIVGVEEDLFPAQQCAYSQSALEEERRLFYVALTRAEKRVFLSYADTRYRNGTIVYSKPSRFIQEVDPIYMEGDSLPSTLRRSTKSMLTNREERVSRRVVTPTTNRQKHEVPEIDKSELVPADIEKLTPDTIVYHRNFGNGKILSVEGVTPNKKAKVYFAKFGEKLLLLKYAKLFTEKDG